MTPLLLFLLGINCWTLALVLQHTAPTVDLTIRDVTSALFALVGSGALTAAVWGWLP